MSDQADKLRLLASSHHNKAGMPRLVSVIGGNDGVGTTSIAVNLAVLLAKQGQHVVLVDTNLHRGDVSTLCGVSERYTLADVMAARKTVRKLLQRGPHGISFICGGWTIRHQADSPAGRERFPRQIDILQADWLVADLGNGTTPLEQRLWSRSHTCLVVTTTDSVSLLNTYATIKQNLRRDERIPTVSLVNKAPSEQAGHDVQLRLDRSCQHFLRTPVERGCLIRTDLRFIAAANEQVPLAVRNPNCAAIRSLSLFSERLSSPSDNFFENRLNFAATSGRLQDTTSPLHRFQNARIAESLTAKRKHLMKNKSARVEPVASSEKSVGLTGP